MFSFTLLALQRWIELLRVAVILLELLGNLGREVVEDGGRILV